MRRRVRRNSRSYGPRTPGPIPATMRSPVLLRQRFLWLEATSPTSTAAFDTFFSPKTTFATNSPALSRWTKPMAPAQCSSISPSAPGRLRYSRALNISADWLPPTFEGHEITGEVNQEAAAADRLARRNSRGRRRRRSVCASNWRRSDSSGNFGSDTWHIRRCVCDDGVAGDRTTGRLHAFCHAVAGRWHLMGVMLSAAGSLQWYRDTLARDRSFEQLVNEASEIPAGSEGLIFLPYLSGERTPHADPLRAARGSD